MWPQNQSLTITSGTLKRETLSFCVSISICLFVCLSARPDTYGGGSRRVDLRRVPLPAPLLFAQLGVSLLVFHKRDFMVIVVDLQ